MDDMVYWLCRGIGEVICALLFRIHRIGFEQVPPGPYLLACNHTSHFDPPLLVVAMTQRVDYMTMIELFQSRFVAGWLRMVGAFPVDRNKSDIRAVRTVLRRLKQGHIVGLFPEGGIRTGKESIIEGASARRGIATLSHLSHCPIRTCLIIGADQLYDWRSWVRRPSIYLVYGPELIPDPSLPKVEARKQLTGEVETSLRAMFQKLRSETNLTEEALPRTAQERWGGSPLNP